MESRTEATVTSVDEAVEFAKKVGYPIKLASTFSIHWQAEAKNEIELRMLVDRAIEISPVEEATLQSCAIV